MKNPSLAGNLISMYFGNVVFPKGILLHHMMRLLELHCQLSRKSILRVVLVSNLCLIWTHDYIRRIVSRMHSFPLFAKQKAIKYIPTNDIEKALLESPVFKSSVSECLNELIICSIVSTCHCF